MYAAAGGLSLAKRQERRNLKKQNSAGDSHRPGAQRHTPTARAPATPLPPIRHSRQDLSHSHLNLPQGDKPTHPRPHSPHGNQLLLPPHHAQYAVSPGGEDPRFDDGDAASTRWSRQASYCELNGRITAFGSSDLFSESQQGKAAWQERDRERRASITEVAVNHRIKATEAHRRWMKRNRIHDSSFGGSSSDEDEYPGGVYGHQSAAANALLYVGLGTVAIGLVIAFVGTGEKGFKTVELRLIGPSLICSGVLCCLVRVFLCVCPSRCLRRRHRHRHKKSGGPSGPLNHRGFFETSDKQGGGEGALTEDIPLADHTPSLFHKSVKKNVSILTTTAPVPSSSSAGRSVPFPGPPSVSGKPRPHLQQPSSSTASDVMTSTTLFLQNEQQRACSAVQHRVPAINIPNFINGDHSEEDDPPPDRDRRRDGGRGGRHPSVDLELRHLDAGSLDVSSFDSSDSHSGWRERASSSTKGAKCDKITRLRMPMNLRNGPGVAGSSSGSAWRSGGQGRLADSPDVQGLEEELSLLSRDCDLDRLSLAANSKSAASSPAKDGEKDNLLPSELVLSPSKLQQESRDT